MEKREYRLNETFEYNGVKLEVVKDKKCSKCYFHSFKSCPTNLYCMSHDREDNLNVIFKEVKK